MDEVSYSLCRYGNNLLIKNKGLHVPIFIGRWRPGRRGEAVFGVLFPNLGNGDQFQPPR